MPVELPGRQHQPVVLPALLPWLAEAHAIEAVDAAAEGVAQRLDQRGVVEQRMHRLGIDDTHRKITRG